MAKKNVFSSVLGFIRDALRMLLYFFFPAFAPPKAPPQDRIDIDM